jgi:hypothetical protein
MEISGVTPSNVLQAVLDAFAEIAEGDAQALPAELPADMTFDELARSLGTNLGNLTSPPSQTSVIGSAVDHGPLTATADSDIPHPDARPDKGAESARVQSFARPNTAAPDRPASDGVNAPGASVSSGFSLPADQLHSAVLIGLQVEPAFPWQLQRRGFDTRPGEVPAPRTETPPPAADHDSAGTAQEQDDDTPAAEQHSSVAPRSGVAPDDSVDDGWCEPLTIALREALRSKSVPPALKAAADQWRLGRCIVLACPQGSDPTAAAWAFVLWPKPGWRAGAPIALFGLRVDARLHWSRLPPSIDWCHARVMKEQHPRQGRQLVAVDARGTATVPCEVQLGPVPLRTPRWRDACVRIDAVRRLWSALGEQWSVTVVVGSRPMPGVGARQAGASPC